jgi:EPS-associated MarR family transcriptional regulator
MLSDELRYKLLKLLDANPALSQRDLARELGLSLGKVNFCMRALIERGSVKATNFTNSKNRKAYMYLLTPRGIEEKARMTARFLKLKMREYELLRKEIEELRDLARQSQRLQRVKALKCSTTRPY